MNGGAGNDIFHATSGDDVVDGIDTADYSALSTAVTVFLSDTGVGTAVSSDGGSDTLRGIENVKGGAGNDVFVASTAASVMEGGVGNDVFVFNSAAHADGDTIVDFHEGDLIDLQPLFASLSLGTDAGTHVNAATTFKAAGEFRLRTDGLDTVIEGTTDGDGDIDFAIRVLNRTDLVVASAAHAAGTAIFNFGPVAPFSPPLLEISSRFGTANNVAPYLLRDRLPCLSFIN